MFLVYLTFFSIIGVLSYIIYNLLRKVEKLEDIILDHQKYIFRVSDVIKQSNELINEVDQKGTFRSDDEVGRFFEYLKEIQSTLDDYKISDLNGKKTE